MKKNILIFSFLIICIACENKNNENTKQKNEPQKSEQISGEKKTTETAEANKKVASENKWYSKNFYGNGETEYLDQISYTKEGNDKVYFTDFYYYSSKNPQKIQLQIHSEQNFKEGMEGRTEYTVSSTNQKSTYLIITRPGYLGCQNPDGKIQEFVYQQ